MMYEKILDELTAIRELLYVIYVIMGGVEKTNEIAEENKTIITELNERW